MAAPPAGVTRIWGADAQDILGISSSAPDINGDSIPDLVIGAPYAASLANSRYQAGEVYLVYGQATPLADIDLAAPPAGVVRLWGAESDDEFGIALAAGDVNGDQI